MPTHAQRQELEAQLPEIYEEVLAAITAMVGTVGDGLLRYLPTAASPEDIMQGVLVSLLAGKRGWPEGVRLRTFLKVSARSVLANLLTSGAARERALDDLGTGPSEDDVGEDDGLDAADLLPQSIPNPEQAFLRQEREGRMLEELEHALCGDAESQQVSDAISRDAEVRREIAADTGLSVNRVDAAMKRMKRRLERCAKNWRKP